MAKLSKKIVSTKKKQRKAKTPPKKVGATTSPPVIFSTVNLELGKAFTVDQSTSQSTALAKTVTGGITAQDRKRVQALFMHGPAGLLEGGMSQEDYATFIGRDAVRAELEMLRVEFAGALGLLARAQFMARRDMSRLVPLATQVIKRSLEGVVVLRDGMGNVCLDAFMKPIVISEPPSDAQVGAARDLLNRMGVTYDDKQIEANTSVNVQLNLERGVTPVKIEYADADIKDEQRALSRERMRTAMTHLFADVLDGNKIIDAHFFPPAKKRKSKIVVANVIGKGAK